MLSGCSSTASSMVRVIMLGQQNSTIQKASACKALPCQLPNGGLNREGVITFPDNSTYIGPLKYGIPNGDKGMLRYADGSIYTGPFHNGEPNNKGVLTYTDGSTYSGQFQNRQPHGIGILKYPNGRSYEGVFQNGQPNTEGVLKYADGSIYTGPFKNGQPYGDKGMLTLADGSTYKGQFQNGKPHGTGTLTFSDGRMYQGEFKNGLRNGQGILRKPNGEKTYEGGFQNGQPHGIGKLVYAGGATCVWTFDYGTPVHMLETILKGQLTNVQLESIRGILTCPISYDLLYDPVILTNGQTFEFEEIGRWFQNGNTKCPLTREEVNYQQVAFYPSLNDLLKAVKEGKNDEIARIIDDLPDNIVVTDVNGTVIVCDGANAPGGRTVVLFKQLKAVMQKKQVRLESYASMARGFTF